LATHDDNDVQPLASVDVHAEHAPPGTEPHPASHPSVGLLLVSNVFVWQVIAVHPLATPDVHAEHVPSVSEAQGVH